MTNRPDDTQLLSLYHAWKSLDLKILKVSKDWPINLELHTKTTLEVYYLDKCKGNNAYW